MSVTELNSPSIISSEGEMRNSTSDWNFIKKSERKTINADKSEMQISRVQGCDEDLTSNLISIDFGAGVREVREGKGASFRYDIKGSSRRLTSDVCIFCILYLDINLKKQGLVK